MFLKKKERKKYIDSFFKQHLSITPTGGPNGFLLCTGFYEKVPGHSSTLWLHEEAPFSN